MPKWNKQTLDEYCYVYHVPIISFIGSKSGDRYQRIQVKGSSLHLWQHQTVDRLLVEKSSLNKVAKAGVERRGVSSNQWVLFENDDSTKFEPLLSVLSDEKSKLFAAIWDKGQEDGVQRVLFGHNITDWTVKLIFYDTLNWALGNSSSFSLERFVEIDIDDIFVGAQGTRIVEEDVRALLRCQNEFRKYVQNFTFMLGFSGSYFRNGDSDEDRGDEYLVEMASNFLWFPHMWRHNHAHEHNFTYLEAIMSQNKLFAESMKLPVKHGYAIAPQHDGVFPVHEEMYKAWKKVWNVSVTATEEYPHFKPPSERRGFIYKNVSVLPRQTCGLYTHTQFFDDYPDGFDKVISSLRGGDLFFTIVTNPVSIFMTHQQNYAHDRLAIYTFENLFRFVRCWTNLRLRWQDPLASAKEYFRLFSGEKFPIWTDPCTDSRHRTIVPPTFNCSARVLPNLLIVGPQKTGTTALSSFLTLHPDVSQNSPDPRSFEELQFFGGSNYENGIEWYSRHFRHSIVVFEKSATYFDNPNAPKQAAALVPNTKVLIVLYDPAKRAYSWFQHLIAHNDSGALSAGSLDVILDANEGFAEEGTSLKNVEAWKKIARRCLSGGRYTQHLERWLQFFPLSQIVFLDGEKFLEKPAEVLHELVEKLDLPAFDFANYIKFSKSKGFHCRVVQNKLKCLGKGKGRSYAPMSEATRMRLGKHFSLHNSALHKFLRRSGEPVPKWLKID
ncbi:unnamed protein product [Caenorhabditis auriculariae]|uniref:[heparan sulfate]-glucosamine N-sulfotransferase n=1 Tax=Caenorhabditis auriculariae TaxID=2777116 RepID=A0A8S1H766_9PELO|nr:unnamed protein product [Caenorhabditis auriculariae]